MHRNFRIDELVSLYDCHGVTGEAISDPNASLSPLSVCYNTCKSICWYVSVPYRKGLYHSSAKPLLVLVSLRFSQSALGKFFNGLVHGCPTGFAASPSFSFPGGGCDIA